MLISTISILRLPCTHHLDLVRLASGIYGKTSDDSRLFAIYYDRDSILRWPKLHHDAAKSDRACEVCTRVPFLTCSSASCSDWWGFCFSVSKVRRRDQQRSKRSKFLPGSRSVTDPCHFGKGFDSTKKFFLFFFLFFFSLAHRIRRSLGSCKVPLPLRKSHLSTAALPDRPAPNFIPVTCYLLGRVLRTFVL